MLTHVILPYGTPVSISLCLAPKDLADNRDVRARCRSGRLEAWLVEKESVVRALATCLWRASVCTLCHCWGDTDAFRMSAKATWELGTRNLGDK